MFDDTASNRVSFFAKHIYHIYIFTNLLHTAGELNLCEQKFHVLKDL